MNADVTVLLHNNMLYGMTGGQHSALTPEGFATSTTPQGNWVPAIDLEHFLRRCQGPYFARKLATDADLGETMAEAMAFPGFAVVEILELCTGFGVPLNRLSDPSLRRMAEERGLRLGVLIKREDRRPYHEVYRARFPTREGDAAMDEHGDERPTFEHRLKRPTTLVLAGSAGERVQTAAAIVCQAAVLSGLHCVQKNDYPVTVGTGFSLSEIKLSPEPILYTGADEPDGVLIVSADGLREVTSRGDLGRLAPGGMVLVDASLAEQVAACASLPLRSDLSPSMAALGAVCAFAARTGALQREALVAAAAELYPEHASKLRETIERGYRE